MEIRHADLQIEVEDAEDGGVLLTIIDSARLSLSLPRKTATELLDATPMKTMATLLLTIPMTISVTAHASCRRRISFKRYSQSN